MKQFIALICFLSTILFVNADYTACGLSSPHHFVLWNDQFTSNAPLFYPTTEAELASLVLAANNYPGCKVRPAGTGGSTDGIVVEKLETNVIVINLADLEPHTNWNGQITGSFSIKIGAGRTLLDLMAIARPVGLLPITQSTTRTFQLGGAFLNPSYHGATYFADRAAKYVNSLRVLKATGVYEEISDPSEVAIWRGSLGLLGIVVGLEIQLKPDVGLHHIYDETFLNFTAGNVEVATQFQTFVGTKLFTTNAGQFFFNIYTQVLFGLFLDADGEPMFDPSVTSPIYAGLKAASPLLAKQGAEKLDIGSLPFQNYTAIQVAAGLSIAAGDQLKSSFLAAETLTRDGYVEVGPGLLKFVTVQKFVKCPSDCIGDSALATLFFVTVQALEQVIGQNMALPEGFQWFPSLLLSWRFVGVSSSPPMLLENLGEGKYISIELETARGLLFDPTRREFFATLETLWIGIASALAGGPGRRLGETKDTFQEFVRRELQAGNKRNAQEWIKTINEFNSLQSSNKKNSRNLDTSLPFGEHVGKEYAYASYGACSPTPLIGSGVGAVFDASVRTAFKAAMDVYDPTGLFAAGDGMRLLNIPFNPSALAVDPSLPVYEERKLHGEPCETGCDCVSSCCSGGFTCDDTCGGTIPITPAPSMSPSSLLSDHCGLYIGDPHLLRSTVILPDRTTIIDLPTHHCNNSGWRTLAESTAWKVQVLQVFYDQFTSPSLVQQVKFTSKTGGLETFTMGLDPVVNWADATIGQFVIAEVSTVGMLITKSGVTGDLGLRVEIDRSQFVMGMETIQILSVSLCSPYATSGLIIDGCAPEDLLDFEVQGKRGGGDTRRLAQVPQAPECQIFQGTNFYEACNIDVNALNGADSSEIIAFYTNAVSSYQSVQNGDSPLK